MGKFELEDFVSRSGLGVSGRENFFCITFFERDGMFRLRILFDILR